MQRYKERASECRISTAMKVFLAFLALAIWFASCAADTLTTNAPSYQPGDPIVITLQTTNVYDSVVITVNNPSIVFGSISDILNGFTGTLTFKGTVTCEMFATVFIPNTLNIVVTGILLSDHTTPITTNHSVNITDNVCQVYFVTPATDPAQITRRKVRQSVDPAG